ncbi:hypothetical protein L1049_007936 [Liquidambar formosana]|uniref:DEAD-box ATP-dependent RNA helicase 48 n=1 Tax=Liquidambar formosana TaxID=63359 RepID=A0AAP0X539_LIQFO
MSLLQISLSTIPTPPRNLSFSTSLTSPNPLFLHSKFSHLSLHTQPPKTTPIRMGGGPRTYPGGVSKWQWKRMQAKKAKQLLKARLCRERQIYEMRKRAELKAAVSELERPWEVVERAPTLFSVKADEQLKVLADRFQNPGGFDLWSEKDGPQLFDTVDGVPSSRFFPKGVVHSIKPYERIARSDDEEAENGGGMVVQGNGYNNNRRNSRRRLRGSISEGEVELSAREDSSDASATNSVELSGVSRSGKSASGKVRKKGNRRRFGSADSNGLNVMDSGQVGFDKERRGKNVSMRNGDSRFRKGHGSNTLKDVNSEVYDMNLQQDGSYGF